MTRHRQSSKALAAQTDPTLPPTVELTAPDDCRILRPCVFFHNGGTAAQLSNVCPHAADCPPICQIREYLSESIGKLEIDIGFGMGRFILSHAALNPNIRMVGIERESVRVAIVDVAARKRRIRNLRLVGGEALPFVQTCVPAESVSAFYLFFPDPWPKARHRKNRLFKKNFIPAVYDALVPGGVLNVATDFTDYFDEMSSLMKDNPRFEKIPAYVRNEDEQTDFEIRFENKNMTLYSASWRKLCKNCV